MKVKKALQVILYILCIFGCLYQICEISILYFSYETTTLVKYEIENPISLPAITLCSHKYLFIKEEYLINYSSINLLLLSHMKIGM